MGGKPIKDGPQYIIDPATECWIWQLYKDKKGYGILKRKGKNHKAHRFFYERKKGKIPDDLQIDHICRNTSCINPDHLEIVNNAENCRRGSNAKLKESDVAKIRKWLSDGIKQVAIANEFNVSPCCINDILKERTWI